MRDGWVETTLGDVAEWWSGGTPKAREPKYYENGTIPWAVIADMNKGIINSTNSSITEDALDLIGGRLAPVGSVLISMYASVGKSAIANIPLATNQAIAWSVPNQEKIIPFYLYLVSQQLEKEISDIARGATQRNINRQMLREFTFQLPPLLEQKRIVDLISSVDSYIEALQQRLESAKQSRNAFIESQILELSDSSLISLKNLTTKIGSGATPRGGEEVYIETGVNLIRSQNVHDSNFVMRGLVAIEDSAAKALDNVTVEEGDVLINITGASVTRCCVVDSTILPARVNQHVAIVRSDRAKILPKYLVLVLTSNEVKRFLNDIAGTGSTRQALTKTHLEDLEIPVPSISKQAAIIENSDAFDTTISKSQITLDRAKFLRSGLLSELLAGEHEIPASYDKAMGAK